MITKTNYYDQICNIVKRKDDLSVPAYDIYKYGTDRFGNAYILYKQYDQNATASDKENVLGQLWIRLKDHPLAFPAFTGKYPNIDVNANDFNGKILYLPTARITDKDSNVHIPDNMQYFFDFEFDSTKRTIALNTYPINNSQYVAMT